MSDETKKKLIELFESFTRLFNKLFNNDEIFKKNIIISTLNKS